jgi:hypothetical protein
MKVNPRESQAREDLIIDYKACRQKRRLAGRSARMIALTGATGLLLGGSTPGLPGTCSMGNVPFLECGKRLFSRSFPICFHNSLQPNRRHVQSTAH